MDSKICFKCNVLWPLHYFYKHKQMTDGHLNKCKKCVKEYANKHRQKNLEKIRAYDRDRFKIDINRRSYAMASMKNQRIKYPEKYKARTAVNNAIRDKKIEKLPCAICGNEKSTAHHEDYSKPLEVVWVCLICHHELERK